jgi:hypothetical protein
MNKHERGAEKLLFFVATPLFERGVRIIAKEGDRG